ncbi:unnamed protein product, partial [Didymodactylos carnosus]
MSDSGHDKSLRSQAIAESILNHLFLPLYLPSSANDDYLIQHDHRNEYKLLECITEFLKSLEKKLALPTFSTLINCIERWSVIQNPKNCSVSNLQLTIEQLAPGDFLSLYFHAQNAAVLIEIDENSLNQPLVSSWQVLLPIQTVTSSLEPHISCFPVPIFRLSNRTQLSSRVHCELLVDFMKNTIEYSKSFKSSCSFNEIRDVPVAHYVCEWWIMQLQGIKIENNSNPCYQFKKKHRDHIRWNSAQLPFRRSGLWMTIKVVLHTILNKRLGNIGHIVYKLLITSFLTHIIFTQHNPTDLLMHCIRKIVRRLNKIEVLLSSTNSNDMNEWIRYIKEEIKLKIDRIFPKSDFSKSIEMNEKTNKSWSIFRRQLDHIQVYQHSCTELKAYLNTHRSNEPYNMFSCASNSNDSTLSNVNQVDYIPSIEVLTNKCNYSIGISLTRVEIWVGSCLKQWINGPSSSNIQENRFDILLHFFENYQSVALNHYCPNANSTDSIGYSRFILTSLTIIYFMHKKLCHDERFERLKFHTIDIPNLLNLFEYLILPNREDMIRARGLYDYFSQYKQKPYPDLFKDIESGNAFGVDFAARSASMSDSLRKIRAQSERDKQDKIQEVNNAKERYRQLIDTASRFECECRIYRYNRQCDLCSILKQANNIQVHIYECPVPSSHESSLAVIFELQMPIEMRCYRDIVWQFINRLHSQPQNNMYEWLKVPPHAGKLNPFYSGPTNCKVKLVSSTKSITQTHYSTPPSITSTPVEEFLYENSLLVQISPTKPIKFESECCMLTPQLNHPDYKHLQFTISNTQFVQNSVIAQLSNCPLRMKPAQHVEFGSFRSGHRLQWWNLLSVLEMESLAIDEESVVILIAHSLWQYGPVTAHGNTLVSSWCPESHQQLLEDHFVDELILRLNRRLDNCEFNWQNELLLVVITIITMRILVICNSTQESQLAVLALRCRQVGEKWIELISESIQTILTNLDQVGILRDKIAIISLACLFTFSVESDRIRSVLSSNEHVVSLLKATTTIHDNMILNKNQTNMSVFMRDMMRMRERVLVRIQPSVALFIEKTSYRSLNEFSAIYWAMIRSKSTMNAKWKKRKLDFYDGWYDGQYETAMISIDCISGTFLVNGMTIGFLPEKITSNPLFVRVFDHHIFEVQATQSHNTYITKHAYHGNGRVRYEFHFDDRTQCLTIHEWHIETNEKFELISHTYFEKELPDAFVSNHSHWRNTKTQQIVFRPVHFKDSDFLENKPYVLTMETGFITTTETVQAQILVNRSSEFFKNLFRQYFIRLDDEPYVYMLREDASHIIQQFQSSQPNTTVHIHLSRLGIAFTYDAQQNIITSREYSDMCIDEDQWLGTLSGLQSGLLLSSLSAIHQRRGHYNCRKWIVPYGKIHPHRAKDKSQIGIIQRAPPSTPFVRKYFVFILNDRLRILQSTDSPTGWLYLALLHAMTSHPLPDQYTGMTGMERSFQLLNSAGCWADQPFDSLSLDILRQIATISPKANYYPTHLTCMEKVDWNSHCLPYSMQHFGYYLIVKKLIDTSQQLNFMHPSSSTSSETSEWLLSHQYNEKLLAKLYLDYRDSYNPTVRLSAQMEAEFLCTSLAKPYQPIRESCSYETNYSPIRLVDSLYRSGNVDLKDISNLNCFPLSRWVTNEYQLKNIWIGLLKFAYQLKTGKVDNRRIEMKRFEMLLDFLHYISAKCSIKPFYLQMLKTVLKVSTIPLGAISYPPFVQYENIEEISVQPERIKFPRKLARSNQPKALAEVEDCFAKNSIYQNQSFPERGIDTFAINRLLKSWRSNSELRSFLENVQSQFCSATIEQLNIKVPVDTQQFAVELFQDHYQIQLTSKDKSIDQKLLESAAQKFLHPHSGYFIKPTVSIQTINQRKAFPDEIFPSKSSLSDIANHFKNQLTESWEKLLSSEEYRKEYPSIKEINTFLNFVRQESIQFWNELVKSVTLPNKLLFKTGMVLRIIPTTLISVFQQIWLNEEQQQLDGSDFSSLGVVVKARKSPPLFLTIKQRTLLGGTMVNWIVEQQIERALHFASHKKWEDFEKEISNVPHVNWTPSKHVPWLIMELEMNITIRKIQTEVARHMIQPKMIKNNSTIQNTVMQMNMGEGKTSVILPMLALSLSSSSSSLVRVIVLKSLFPVNYQSLRYKLGGLLNRRVLSFACRRDMNFSDAQVNQIFDRLKQGLSNFDVVLTSPEDILSFDLLTIDKCRRNEFDIGRSMLSVQRWLKIFARDVLDESDEILHVKYQLIYTVGGQQQIDGGLERWKTIQSVLNLVKQHAANIAQQYSNEVSYKPSRHKSRYPRFRLLSNLPFPFLCRKIAHDWLNEKHYRQVDQQLISDFILETNSSIDCLINRFPHNAIQLFLILRGLLSSEVLLVAFKKRYRVNFGVNPNPSFDRFMAVPFRAKDVPADKTEFGHVDVAIVLTQLSYYYSGLNDSQILQCFNLLSEEERDPESIYEEWISNDDEDKIHASIKQWKGINLKDYRQRTRYLFPTLRYNMFIINYFLNHFVFPREVRQFPHKLVSSAWDLSSPSRSKIITGFSGTNDTQLILPIHICQYDLPELRKTDAIVVNNLLRPENENYQFLPINATTSDILTEIVNYKSSIQVILDVGALLVDRTNCEIAVKWLNMSDKTKIDYAVYFESDSIVACDRQFHRHLFLTSPASERLDRSVVYLDEIHTRGTDFKFPNGFRAAVTLGSGLTKDRLVQACMRMRKLGHDHSLSFWSSNEVHQQIRTLKKDSGRKKNQERNTSNQNDRISLTDILRWVYENTQWATWDGFHHWATQSLSFQRKVAAFRNIQWQNLQQSFTNTMMQELARECLEPEIIELKRMYGASKKMQTVSAIYLARYRQSNICSSVEIHNNVSKQLCNYSGSEKRLAQLLDEEQERELEQELEEEQQHVRPPSVSPCKPILHNEIKRFCDTHDAKMNLNQLTSVFRPLAHAFMDTTLFQDCQPNSWQRNLWISTELQRVIQTEGESLDPFLRPPRWIVIYRGEDIIFVSAFEANWLIGRLNSLYHQQKSNRSLTTTLRLLLPRTKRNQSIFINTPTLTIPPSIVPSKDPIFITIPVERLAELFIFNGTLYFETVHEQKAYCEFLGICPKPRTSIEEDAFEKGWVAVDGFVTKPKHRCHLHIAQCRFTSSPLKFVKQLVENRNNSHAPLIYSGYLGDLRYSGYLGDLR